ncbi:MAG: hypothetical protein KatS3mg129_3076 [Leptospiraceae bacterium]|nr:MAG: hypothetical protein KatS3mg129_3076 [Leptospiraceae bacterium]
MKPIKMNLTIQPENLIKTGLFLIIAILIFTAGFYFGRLHYEKTELTTLDQCKPEPHEKIIIQFEWEDLKEIEVKKEDYLDLCLFFKSYIYPSISVNN